MEKSQVNQLKYLLEKVEDLKFSFERSKNIISPLLVEDVIIDLNKIQKKITSILPVEEKIFLKTGNFLNVETLQNLLNEKFNLNGNNWVFERTDKEGLVKFIKSENLVFEKDEDLESNELNLYHFICDENTADEIYFAEIVTLPGCVYYYFGSDKHGNNFSGLSDNEKFKETLTSLAKTITVEQDFNNFKEKFWYELVRDDALNGLHDSAIDNLVELEQPLTQDELKIIYDMLPKNIIYEAKKWGFSDTVVGDSVYKFVENNLDEVKKILYN